MTTTKGTASGARSQLHRGPEVLEHSPAHAGPVPALAGRADVLAGLLAAVGCVLLGAPTGLLWAAVAPKVIVDVTGGQVSLVSDASVFIAGDGWFLGVALCVGLLAGAIAWVLGRRHGPGVVLGLAVGGLLAGYVAARTGELVDAGTARQAVEAGRTGALQLSLVLRSTEAILAWPVGALLGFLTPALLHRE